MKQPISQAPLDRIEAWAGEDATLPAVIDKGGGLTYGDVVATSQLLAEALRQGGIGEGETVAIETARRRQAIPALLAIWRIGAAYVPVDASWPRDRMSDVLEDAAARAVVVFDELSAFEEHEIGILDASNSAWLVRPPKRAADLAPDLAYVLYTSGSTGRPKGVEVPLGAVTSLFTKNEGWIGVGPGDTGVCFHSMTFDVSVWEIFRPLTRGACVALCDSLAMVDLRRLLDWAGDNEATHLCMTPTAFRAFSHSALADRTALPRLRTILLAGEALRFSDLRPWMDSFGDDGPEIWNVYGPTEATVYATARRVRPRDALEERRCLIGTSLGHTTVSVAPSPQDGAPDRGEIEISGMGVARGYRNLAALTAERFPVRDGAPVFRTGDLGRVTPEGEIEFLGRLDSQVKVRGFRIELEEIEVCMRRHPDVRDCVATVCRINNDTDDIVVGVVPSRPGVVDARSLRTFLADYLPRFMRPARIVELAHLPLNQSGKLDRSAATSQVSARLQGR